MNQKCLTKKRHFSRVTPWLLVHSSQRNQWPLQVTPDWSPSRIILRNCYKAL